MILIDAVHKKVRRGHVSSEDFYVVIGLTETMQGEVLANDNIPGESASGWSKLLESLKAKGLTQTDLVIADGLPRGRSHDSSSFS